MITSILKSGRGAGKPARQLEDIVKENVDTLVLAFESAGFKSEGWKRGGTVEWHVKCVRALKGDWMAFYKYKIAAFFSHWMGVEVATSPLIGTACAEDSAAVVLGGRAAMWVKSLKQKKDGEVTLRRVCVSVLYSKKGMVRPDAEQLKAGKVKAFKKLTAPISEPARVQWADVEDDEEELLPETEKSEMRYQLQRTAAEVGGVKHFTLEMARSMVMPTTSAVYTKTVAKGGMIGELLSNGEVLELFKEFPELLVEVELDEEGLYRVQDAELRIAFGRLLDLCWKKAIDEDDSAEFVSLPEALKIRVITKGPPYRNFVLKTLQRYLWRLVRHSPNGKLVGEYISEEALCAQIGALREGEEYVSVDYSDATNEVAGWASEVVIDTLAPMIGLTEAQARVAKANLTGHTFKNPENKRELKRQTQGQLMGSILSFPVLCIINMAICRRAIERDRKRNGMLLKHCPFLVNGDDAVLRGKEVHKYWKGLAGAVGLSPSPGKVYRSKDFLNMNSTHYDVTEPYERPGVEPVVKVTTALLPNGAVKVGMTVSKGTASSVLFLRRLEYVNLGLLKGYKRSEVKASVADVGLPDSIGAIARWLVLSSPPEMREWILKKYLNTHWAELSKTSLPWFLPEHLGGLGIPRPTGDIGQKGLKSDMRLAAVLYKHPLPARPATKEWKMMERASADMQKARVVPAVVIGGDAEGAFGLRSLFVMSALLKAKSLRQLFKPQDTDDAQKEVRMKYSKYLDRVEKAIKKARKLMGTVQPFEPDALPVKPQASEAFLTADAVISTVEAAQGQDDTLPPLLMPDA